MTGLEYQRTVCPTTKVGKDPLREDVADAFDDGVAEGWKQCKEKQWKPSDEQIGVIEAVINHRSFQRRHLDSLYEQLKKLRESKVWKL